MKITLSICKYIFRSGKISFTSPESILDDSFMMYTSSEDDPDTSRENMESRFSRYNLGLPPRPPSNRSKEKIFVRGSPEALCPTPSSGHFSGESSTSKYPGK